MVARRHTDRLPPRQARWRLGSAPSSLPPADPSARSGRCRAWPTRGSRGLLTAARWPSSIDRRLEKSLGIFALDIVSGVKKRLTPPTMFDILPAFSPDGRTLAFNQTLLGRGPFVHVVPVAGGEPRELAATSFPRGRLAWIPGGKEILFAAVPVADDGGQPRPSAAGRASTPCGESLLTAGRPASWPGARGPWTWPCRRTDGASSIRRGLWTGTSGVLISRGGQRRKTCRPDSSFPPRTTPIPTFAPDGERVAFTSVRSGEPEIWVVDGQARHPLRLTFLGTRDSPLRPGGPRTERRSRSTLQRKVGITWTST